MTQRQILHLATVAQVTAGVGMREVVHKLAEQLTTHPTLRRGPTNRRMAGQGK